MDPDGTGGGREVLATHYDGTELNSPNDVVVKSDGAIYFTDPTYGRMPGFGIEREQDLDFQGVYRIAPGGGDPQLLVDDFAQPNGLCFSTDESLLYINDTTRAHIRVFDVAADGTLANGRVLADGIGTGSLEIGDLVDGMKLDERGNVWVTGPGRRLRLRPRGRAHRHRRGPRERRQPQLGRPGLELAVHPGDDLGVPHPVQGLRQPTPLHEVTDVSDEALQLDPGRSALVIQDLQNDVIIEGGAFADSGAPAHATAQNVVANVADLAAACRAAGVPVIHVWYIVEQGAAGPEAERAAVPGRQGGQRARPRHVGRGAGRRASSPRTATTSSRRCG